MREWRSSKKKVLLDPKLTKIWEEKIARISPFERDFENMMVTFFADQKKEIVSNILNEKSVWEQAAIKLIDQVKGAFVKKTGVVYDFEAWKVNLIERSEPAIRAIIEQFAQDVMDEFAEGSTIVMSLPSIRTEIGRRAADMSQFVNNTTGRKVKALLEEMEAAGLSIQEKADGIANMFDDISPARAKRIARTETMGASNRGTMEGITQGKISGKMWITSRDERVRFSHLIDGQIVPADGFFTLQDGSGVAFPQDINERCVVVPHTIKLELN